MCPNAWMCAVVLCSSDLVSYVKSRRTFQLHYNSNATELKPRTGYIFIQNGCYVCVALKASSIKGGLISEVFHFGSNLFKKVSNHAPEKEIVLRGTFFFEDFSHSERVFEIKPPLYSVPLKILLIMNQLNFCMDFVAIWISFHCFINNKRPFKSLNISILMRAV